MQEKWVAKHENDKAIVSGIAHTARPILSAAAITATVFRIAVPAACNRVSRSSSSTRPRGGGWGGAGATVTAGAAIVHW